MQAYVYSRYSHFSRFIPLSPHAILLWIWYFLIPTRSRLSFVIYRYFSYSVEFYFGLSSRAHCSVTSLILSTFAFIPSLAPSLPPSLPCQSSSHSFVFIFYFSFWRAPFFPFLFYRFIAPRLRVPPFSIIISSLAFSTLYLLTRSSLYLLNSLSISSIHTTTRSEMDFHSLRVILAYDGLRT